MGAGELEHCADWFTAAVNLAAAELVLGGTGQGGARRPWLSPLGDLEAGEVELGQGRDLEAGEVPAGRGPVEPLGPLGGPRTRQRLAGDR